MSTFYDTHAHLDYPDFAQELPQLVARARAAGVTRMISIGTDLESSRRAVALAEQFEEVYAAAGWHPTNAAEAPDDLRPALRELGRHPKVVAIGETGFDYYRLLKAGGLEATQMPEPGKLIDSKLGYYIRPGKQIGRAHV